MAVFAIAFLPHHAEENQHLSDQRRQHIIARHLGKLYASRFTRRTANGEPEEASSFRTHLQKILRKLERELRNPDVNSGFLGSGQEPVPLQLSFIVDLGIDAFLS